MTNKDKLSKTLDLFAEALDLIEEIANDTNDIQLALVIEKITDQLDVITSRWMREDRKN